MENNFNLLSINYIVNTILNNYNSNLLIKNLNEDKILEIVREISYNYMFNKDQILIISDIYTDNLIEEDLFKSLDNRLINLQEDYSIKDRLNKVLDCLTDKTGKTNISKVELLNRSIMKKLQILNSINSIFYKYKNNDISLIEKYINTHNLNISSSYDNFYKRFRIKKPLNDYSYSEVVLACNKILDSDTCSNYIKYRRFTDNNLFKCLKSPLNYNVLKESLDKLNNIISKDINNYKLIHSRYTEDFLNELITNHITEENILSLSNIINLKYNYNLLNNKKKKPWFNIFSKNKNSEEEYGLSLFSNYQKEIFNEYINNFKIIMDLKEKLSFLEEVLIDESYNELLTIIIREDDLKDILTFYSKLLSKAYSTKANFDFINKLSTLEMLILNYCYNDVDKRNELNETINLIPKFKLYLDIEEAELKHSDLIKIYKEYDKIVEDIYNEVNIRNILILSSINNIWDNKVREEYPVLIENKKYISDQDLKRFFPCIISNYSKEKLEELLDSDFFFKKVILIFDNPKKNLYLDELRKISENIIILTKSKDYSILNFNTINEISLNSSNKYNEEFILVYKNIENYLINKRPNLKVDFNNDHIEISNNHKKIIVKISPYIEEDFMKQEIRDIFLYNYYKENNIKLYRLWYRDWWLDKFKELKNIEKFIME